MVQVTDYFNRLSKQNKNLHKLVSSKLHLEDKNEDAHLCCPVILRCNMQHFYTQNIQNSF